MGAIILNGAKIGQNCLIGAGALVKEGAEIPDNSLVVGAPGKIIRQMDIDGIKKLKNSAIEYQVKMKKFKETLNKI
jgi:carbonic anhydrase/acetyltransferase-like protein (isoleucine patch superfamily)